MTYSTFPAVPLKSELSKEVRSLATKQPLGDGYTYITQFGLHPLEETWRVRMLIKLSEAATVRSFLEARATDGKPFFWTPPDHAVGSTPMWKVEEWPIARKFQSRVEIELQLRRVWGKLANIGGMQLGGVPNYTSGQPDFGDAVWVRWVGVQWSERGRGFSGGAQLYPRPDPNGPPNIVSGWLPLRNTEGQLITYGIGGIDLTNPPWFNAVGYLGPWYSNIDVYIPSYPTAGASVGGDLGVFNLYRTLSTSTQPFQSNETNGGYGFSRYAPDTSNFAESRGRWEFADSNYNVLFTWAGYSKLR
jgi:phage-related protein